MRINAIIPEGVFAINADDRRVGTIPLPLFDLLLFGQALSVADFLKAAAVNDEIVLEDQGIICDGIRAFGVIDIHSAVGLAGCKE